MIMRYCKSCNMKIENNLTHCPLCSCETTVIDDNYNNDYPNIKISRISKTLRNIVLFVSIALIISTISLNIVLESPTPWCIIPCTASIYFYFSTIFFLKKGKNIGLFIFTQVLLTSLVILVIDYVTGFSLWSINYIIPFILIGGCMALEIASFINKFVYKDYIIYLIVIALLGLLPVIFIITGIATIIWTNAVCILYSLLTFIGMFVFSRRRINAEITRRLHF